MAKKLVKKQSGEKERKRKEGAAGLLSKQNLLSVHGPPVTLKECDTPQKRGWNELEPLVKEKSNRPQ
jgi:hypothetical protein